MLRALKRFLPAVAAVALMACAQEAEEATEEAADTTAVAGISLANLAGTWNIRTTPLDSDSTLVEGQITIDDAGWTLHLPDRDPIPNTVTVEGDSVITDSEPFESVLRPGTTVTTHAVYRVEGDRLVGVLTAHYVTSGADSVAQLRIEGTRAP